MDSSAPINELASAGDRKAYYKTWNDLLQWGRYKRGSWTLGSQKYDHTGARLLVGNQFIIP